MGRLPFYWGVGIENCWMAEYNEPNRLAKRSLDVFLQMQHYELWQEDLDLAAGLGVNALRYSVPWYKSNPQPGIYAWDWMTRSLDYLVNRKKITPIIDLIHYGTPLWMENSVFNHAYPQRMAEYASAFARRFVGLVDHFTPHNEPQLSATYCGHNAYWPPYLTGVDGWVQVGLNVARGMILSSQALRTELSDVTLISADCQVSPPPEMIRKAAGFPIPAEEQDEFEYMVKTFPACLAYGCVPVDSAFARFLVEFGLKEAELEWFASQAHAPDFVGHNYYPMFLEDQNNPYEQYMQGGKDALLRRMRKAYTFYRRPLYVSETSGGSTPAEKRQWLEIVIEVVAELRAEGIPVVGINWWPLYETIQWEYRDNTKTALETIIRGGWNNGIYLIEEQFDGSLARVPSGFEKDFREVISKAAERLGPEPEHTLKG
jgi:beta-glucosidase